jgi:hypothetical protein
MKHPSLLFLALALPHAALVAAANAETLTNAVSFTIPAKGAQIVSLPLVTQEGERFKFGDTEFASALSQGSAVLFWDTEQQGWSGGVKGSAGWDPAEADRVLAAGEGFALVNASDEAIAVTVAGSSPSEAHLDRDYAGGNAWSLMAYPYPVAVKFGETELANVLPQGSSVKFWDAAAQAWTGPSKKTARGWPGAAANRELRVGEAFVIQSPSEGTWKAVGP